MQPSMHACPAARTQRIIAQAQFDIVMFCLTSRARALAQNLPLRRAMRITVAHGVSGAAILVKNILEAKNLRLQILEVATI